MSVFKIVNSVLSAHGFEQIGEKEHDALVDEVMKGVSSIRRTKRDKIVKSLLVLARDGYSDGRFGDNDTNIIEIINPFLSLVGADEIKDAGKLVRITVDLCNYIEEKPWYADCPWMLVFEHHGDRTERAIWEALVIHWFSFISGQSASN